MAWVCGLDSAAGRWHAHAVNTETGETWEAFCSEDKKLASPTGDKARKHLIDTFQPFVRQFSGSIDLLVCEEPLALKINPSTTRKLNMAGGSLWTVWALNDGGMWYWCGLSTWKGFLGLKASAKKDEIRSAVIERGFVPDDKIELYDSEPDLFDAVGIARWGVDFLERASIEPAS